MYIEDLGAMPQKIKDELFYVTGLEIDCFESLADAGNDDIIDSFNDVLSNFNGFPNYWILVSSEECEAIYLVFEKNLTPYQAEKLFYSVLVGNGKISVYSLSDSYGIY